MQAAKSVIITCAGIGSRLGLSKTKALININGRSLISLQLELFKNVEDVRVVVGFEANSVIREVLKYRRDVIFVYNHNYFETKTGASFYLGACNANEYVMEYDGDLLVHPDDIKLCLQQKEEFIGYSDKNSDESVFVKTDEQGDVLSFCMENGDYEWTCPVFIKKSKINYSSNGNVFNQLEKYLPMKGLKIRAFDIDTYSDYCRVKQSIKSWGIV
jgi:choline kinase